MLLASSPGSLGGGEENNIMVTHEPESPHTIHGLAS